MTWSLHESLSKVQGGESLIFQTYVTFSIDFQHISLLANVIDSFFVVLVNEGDFSRPAPTRFSLPLLFMFLWILFLTKYDKTGWVNGMSQDELTCAQKEVFCKERGSNEKLGKIAADF